MCEAFLEGEGDGWGVTRDDACRVRRPLPSHPNSACSERYAVFSPARLRAAIKRMPPASYYRGVGGRCFPHRSDWGLLAFFLPWLLPYVIDERVLAEDRALSPAGAISDCQSLRRGGVLSLFMFLFLS